MAHHAAYSITVAPAGHRSIAAVSARLHVNRVAAEFAPYLNQVYAAAATGAVHLDGQNVFIYRDVPGLPGEVDADFGVGVTEPFKSVAPLRMIELPGGLAAMTTHRGSYARLGDAYAAVIEWCRANGRPLAGPRWEVYGHWTADESKLQTDVYYLLDPMPRSR